MHVGRNGGVDRYFDGLLTHFAISDCESVGFVFGDNSNVDIPQNVKIVGSPKAKLVHRLRYIREAAEQICKANPKRMIVFASHFALYALPLLKLLKRYPNTRLVSHFHGPWADESAAEGEFRLVTWAKKFVERRVYNASSTVVADSKAFEELSLLRYCYKASKATFVHAGMDAEPFFATSEVPRVVARQRLGWPAERRIVLCVRRLVKRVGVDRLIDAMKQVVAVHPDVLLMIGGKGPLLNELQSQIEASGLQNHVRLLGFVPEDDLPWAYRAADVSIVPSVALEGFGLIAIESLACGTPVLVTPIGGMPEVVRPLCKEWVLNGAEVGDLVDGLTRYFQRSSNTTTPSPEECIQYVRQHFTWSIVAPKLLEIYRSVV